MLDHLRNENKITLPLAVTALLVFMGSVGLFINDQWLDTLLGKGNDGPAIAYVTQASRDVRRRNSERILWNSIQKNDALFEDDIIFSGESSEVSLEFVSGGALYLGENTLINLSRQNGQVFLDLEYGEFTGKLAAGEKLQLGDKTLFGSDNSTLVIQKTDLGTQIKVLDGQISVDGKKLNSDQQTRLLPSGELSKVRNLALEPTFPDYNQTLWLRPSQPLKFQWKALTAKVNYRIELAQDASFEEVFFSQVVTQSSQFFARGLSPGKYYWRVALEDSPQVRSPIVPFTYNHELPVELVYPPSDSAFKVLSQQTPQRALPFVFKEKTPVSSYLLEISETSDFVETIYSQEVKSLRTSQILLPEGAYYWRVKPIDPRRPWAIWSAAQAFSIQKDLWTLEVPLWAHQQYLDFKIPNRKYPQPLYTSRRSVVEDYVKATFRPQLPAPTVGLTPGAEHYEIQWSKNSRFIASAKTPVRTYKSLQENFPLPTVHPGRYFFRTRAASLQAHSSEWSPPLEVQVYLEPPTSLVPEAWQKFEKKKDWKRRVAVGLKWSPLLFAKKYEVHLSRDPSFRNFRKAITNNTIAPARLAPNRQYFWRVRALSAQLEPISPFSDKFPVMFNYELTPHEKRIADIEKVNLRKPSSLQTISVEAHFANWPKWTVEVGSFAGFADYASQLGTTTLATSELSQNQSWYIATNYALTPRWVIKGYYETFGGEFPDALTITDRDFETTALGIEGRYRFFGNLRYGFALYGGFGLETGKNFRFGFAENTADSAFTNRPISSVSGFVSTGLEYRSYHDTAGQLSLIYYQAFSADNASSEEFDLDVANFSQVAIDSSISQPVTENTFLGIGLRYRLLNYQLTSSELGSAQTGTFDTSHLLFRIFLGAETW